MVRVLAGAVWMSMLTGSVAAMGSQLGVAHSSPVKPAEPPPVPAVIDNAATYPMLTPAEFVSRGEEDLREIREIKARLRAHYLDTGKRKLPADVAKWVSQLNAEGAYPDLDYVVRAKMFFPQFPHLQRLSALATAYRSEGHPLFGSAEVKEAIRRGLAYWCRVNPQTDHHWYIEIGAPMELLPTLMLMESELSRHEIAAALPLLRASFRKGLYRFGPGEATGANMMWVARMNLEAGLLEENAFEVARAAQRFAQEIKVTEREGVQTDWSFTQHGRQLYASGYGGAYAADAAHVAWYLGGTRFAFEPWRAEIIANYVLEGQQWMMRGRHWISGPRGREISRRLTGPAVVNPASVPLSVGERLAELLPEKRDRLIAAGKRMTGKVSPDTDELVGNRHFWRVDLMVHHRPGWMAAVRMASNRVVGTESGNTENLLGHHLADGVVEVLVRGDEYRGVWPLWNWRQLPGTTVAQVEGPLPEHQWGKGAVGTTAFVGGVSDGEVGAAAMDFDRDAVKVRKSWFFVADGVVAVGSGLTSQSPAEVLTTLNQCWRRGPVRIGTSSGVVDAADGETRLTGPACVLHDGVGYILPPGAQARLTLESRTSSWNRINQTQPKDEVRGEIFTLALVHGTPQAAQYAYQIVPNATEAVLKEKLAAAPPPLPGNDAHVWEDPATGRTMVVFWTPGTVTTALGEISVDRACAVISTADRAVVADPSAGTGVIRLRVGNRSAEVRLPEGAQAGSSVQVPLAGT